MEVGFGGISLLAVLAFMNAAEPGRVFVILALAALLYVIIRGFADPRTRPFMIWPDSSPRFRALIPHAFLGFCGSRCENQCRPIATNRVIPQAITPTPVPSPPKSSATGTKRPRMTMLAALRQAAVQAWTARGSAPVAEAPAKPASAKVGQPDVPAGPQPPDWVNAAPKLDDGCYTMIVHVGPFTTPLECERELPKALQGAVADYAELSLGRDAASVRLPDDVLQQLVRQRWTEVRPMEIGGSSQDMVTLHAQVVFDAGMQKRIESEAQRLVIGRRVQGAAVVFGGVLGLLALAWGGLRLATRRRSASPRPDGTYGTNGTYRSHKSYKSYCERERIGAPSPTIPTPPMLS